MFEPLIIGHRGASAAAPENTMVAFERAIAAGADGIEFDVQLARDGVPVVIHDASLKRTGLRAHLVAKLSSIELEHVDVGTWFNLRHPARADRIFSTATVPTLARVLNYFRDGNAVLYIEMKCDRDSSHTLANEVARLIRKYHLSDRAIVESFELDSIREIKKLDPEIRTAALFEPKLSVRSRRAMIETALRYEANEIALHRTLASPRTIEEANQHGLQVVVWTADHPTWIARAVNNAVHSIITNEPARMCAVRRNFPSFNANAGSNARLS